MSFLLPEGKDIFGKFMQGWSSLSSDIASYRGKLFFVEATGSGKVVLVLGENDSPVVYMELALVTDETSSSTTEVAIAESEKVEAQALAAGLSVKN